MAPERTSAEAHLAEVEAEQAALRRIAALVARSVPAEEVFDPEQPTLEAEAANA